MARTPGASDTFNSSISANWSNGEGDFDTFTWASGGVIGPTGDDTEAGMRYSAATPAANQYSQLTVDTHSGTDFNALSVRVRCATGTNESCYLATVASTNANGAKYFIYELNSSFGFALLASAGTGSSMSSGVKVTLEAEGTALRLFTDEGGSDTQRVSTTDATLASGSWGVHAYAASTVSRSRITAWEGGDITAGGVAINAGVDALSIAEQAATVKLSRAISAGLDTLALTEQASQIRLSKAVAAGFDALSLTEHTAIIRLSRNIGAGIDTLVISELQANVSTGTGIAAGTDSLVIAEQSANVNRAKAITAGFDALVIAEQAATIRLAKAIAASLDALTITERQAAVSSGLQLSAGLDTLVLTERQALVNRETAITAGFDQLSLTEQQAAVRLSRLISAGVDTLTLQERTAVITLARVIAAGFDQLTIAEQQAIIDAPLAITQVVAERIIQVSQRNSVIRVAPRSGVIVH